MIGLAIPYAVLGGLATYAVMVERHIILVNNYRIPVPNLPSEFNGFKIAHLTDLHCGFLVSLEALENVVQRTNHLHTDIIACTGDYVRERKSSRKVDQVWPVLAKLKAEKGVFSVLGNHDHWADTDRSLYWLEKTGQNLRGKVKSIERSGERIWLAGGGDLWEDHIEFDDLLQDVPEKDCRIVLAHNPDSADSRFNTRIDLMLSGHTHGGQVNLPFVGSPFLSIKNKDYTSGLARSKKDHPVFISKGIGWGFYPARFNCFPEIAVLELICQTKDSRAQ